MFPGHLGWFRHVLGGSRGTYEYWQSLRPLKYYDIISSHYAVQKGTNSASTSAWACSDKAPPLVTVHLMPTCQTPFCSMLYKAAKGMNAGDSASMLTKTLCINTSILGMVAVRTDFNTPHPPPTPPTPKSKESARLSKPPYAAEG